MLIKWKKSGYITLYYGENRKEDLSPVKAGEQEEITPLKENKEDIDMQFEDGAVAFGVDKEAFEIIKR